MTVRSDDCISKIVHLLWWSSFATGNVCNQTGLGLNGLQANLCVLRKDVDTLRNAANLLLDHYMLPHEVHSMTIVA